MRAVPVVIAALLLWVAGCASEREQNVRKFDSLHQDLRKAPPDQPAKWELVPGDETKE